MYEKCLKLYNDQLLKHLALKNFVDAVELFVYGPVFILSIKFVLYWLQNTLLKFKRFFFMFA